MENYLKIQLVIDYILEQSAASMILKEKEKDFWMALYEELKFRSTEASPSYIECDIIPKLNQLVSILNKIIGK